ncbi:hypothetical protein DW322_08790 [Rhodococcus rhodnii]|uniref:Terminase small subunit n=1 Tax=Rhodococcus rhodnii TaxID=38312 RepID=A0A6P2CIS4_9NOCA|nr:hypothetical protein DW322_08790 [Rhodococcus rhodnii]
MRAVPADAKPPAKRAPRRKTVSQAAAGGDRRELLIALRTRVAKAVENAETPARDLASLTRRLQDIAKEIDAIDLAKSEEHSAVANTDDEIWDPEAV